MQLLKKYFDSNTLRFLKHGKNYVGASFFLSGLSVITMPIMTRLLLPSDYGITSVYNSLVTILTVVFALGLNGALGRFYYESIDEFPKFYGTVTITSFFSSLLGLVIIILLRNFLCELLNLPEMLVVLAAGAALFGVSFGLVSSYLTASHESAKLSKISIWRGVGNVAMVIPVTMLLSQNKYLGTVYVGLFWAFVNYVYSIVIFFRVGVLKFNVSQFKYAVLFGLPLVLHGLSGYLLNTFDQVMINKMVGASEAGLYALAYRVGLLFQMVITGLTQAWGPVFFEKMKNDEYDTINKMGKKYSLIVALIALVLAISAPVIVRLLASETYLSALPLVPIIIIGFLFQFFYLMYTGYSFYYHKTGAIGGITTVAGITNVVLNLWAIKRWGYEAAAWTTVVTYALFFILHYVNVKFIIKPKKILPLVHVVLPGGIVMIVILLFKILRVM